MKALKCEMCDSNDLIKQDGYYVCQHCGTKYSVEEAKKLMFDGTVDVSGSVVKVDTTDELTNLYQIARRARDDNNGENAAKYYDMILVKDPTSWEASFYVVYFKAMECKIAQIRSAAISVSNCEDSVLTLIRDHVPEEEQGAAVLEVMLRSIMIGKMLAGGAKSHYDGISASIKNNYTIEYVNNVRAAVDILFTCANQVDAIFGDRKEVGRLAVQGWKNGMELFKKYLPDEAELKSSQQLFAIYVERIGKYDPEYVRQEKKKQLEAEIAGLNRTIAKTPTEPKWNFFGIFLMIIGGILLWFVVQIALWGGDAPVSSTCGGILLFLLGLWIAIPKKKAKERNLKIISDAKEALAQKQQELEKMDS